MVAKMGRVLPMMRHFSAFLPSQSTRQFLQFLVLSYLDYCPVVWSGAENKDIGKLKLVQNRAACIALRCSLKVNVNNMHVNLSWLKVEERWTASLLVFVQGVDVLKVPICRFKQLEHSADTHRYHTRHLIKSNVICHMLCKQQV
jgi:hypothetical protein